ncbi:MAG: amidohydrolase family protein [Chthonomonas sp.]|nr:amidohydrolase family protein [Chthonomonas sp.]
MFRFTRTLVVLASLATVAHAQDQGVALTNCRIEGMQGPAIDKGTIAFREGKITYVGTGGAPNGFKVVDLKGAWVYPGLIDGAMTRGLKLPEPPVNEVRDDSTTVPTRLRPLNRKGVRPDISAADCLDLGPALPAQYSAGFTSAFIVPGVGSFRGQGAVVSLSEARGSVLKAGLGQAMGLTPGVGQGFPSTKFGVMALIRQTMLDAQRYAQFPPSQRSKDLEPLNPLLAVLQRKQPLVWFADSDLDITRVIDLSYEFGAIPWIIGGRDAYRLSNQIKERNIPLIAGVAIGPEPEQSEDNPQPAGYLKQRKDQWKLSAMNLVQLEKQGVEFVLTSLGDVSNNFWPNLRKVVEFGLSKEGAIQALTIRPARLLGVQDQLGSISDGKRACLTVFSGDPFAKSTDVQFVVVDGAFSEEKQ